MRAVLRANKDEYPPIPPEYIWWIRSKKHNSLPLAGGELDQPHVLMLCFDIIDSETHKYDEDRAEEARQVEQQKAHFANPHLKPLVGA
ncbi:hypothetical protein ACFLXQ_01410 [Chloroflexota bacterium]